MMWKLTLGALMVLPAGCARDPATEQPVELQAGLYDVSLGGSSLVKLKVEGRKTQVCLDSSDASEFPHDPLLHLAAHWDGCSTKLDEPRGNAMSGKRMCEDRTTPMTAAYSGSHTADSFEITGAVTQGSDESASVMRLGSGEFSLLGKRVGDCSL
jgi:hypothetical protein